MSTEPPPITAVGEAPAIGYATAQGRWILAATIAGSAMALLDGTVVGIALPYIGRQFHAGVAALQWTVTGYMLTLAGLLLLGGALADRYGRRRVFVIGVIWFAIASVGCGVAPNASTLIIARALQGIGGALLTPGSLAIIQAVIAPKDRARAIGAWSGLSGLATAIGPLLGGYLISAASWRFIFLINVPIALATVWISIRHIPESRDPNAPRRVDYRGATLATVGLIGLTYGIVEAPTLGWSSPGTIASLSVGVLGLGAFVLSELHERAPLLPLSVFASRQFSAANAVTFVVYGAFGGAFFLLPVDLEQVCHYSPIEAGLALFPVTVLMLALSPRSGALAARIGPKLQMGCGPLVIAGGLCLLARITASGDYLTEVLPAALVFGFGLVMTVAPLTATVLAAAPGEHVGVASAVNNDVARTASLLAVAALPPAVGLSGMSYLHAGVFSEGFHRAVIICAALCFIGGVVALISITNRRPVEES